MADSDWRQQTHLVRCEWGPVGAARVAGDGAIVVVDVLSFSTAVSVLVERGTAVLPAPWRDDRAASLAQDHDAELAVGRREVTEASPWSLSPAALRRAPATPRLVLPSPNGSAIAAASTGVVVAACLRNATAVGQWLRSQGYGMDRAVSVIPAGERWPDGSLRPALEDLLGAGAVIAALSAGSLSPEAAAVATLHDAMTPAAVADAVRTCASGRELAAGGFGEDVDIAVEIDESGVVPLLVDGCFRPAS